MRPLKLLYIALFVAMLSIPLLHQLFGVVPALRLGGVTDPWEFNRLSFATLVDGSFQRSFERQFKRSSGIWPYLVRTDNQISFSVFHQVANHYRSAVVLGRNNALIEKAYLPSANKVMTARLSRIERKVEKLAELQHALAEKDIVFLLLISPSKPGIYPEHISSKYSLHPDGEAKNNYDHFIPLLRKAGVRHIDFHERFLRHKNTMQLPLFAHSGTHWNELGSCLAAQTFVEQIEPLLDKRLNRFRCRPISMREVPTYPDRDLARLLNVWDASATYNRSPQPAHTLVRHGSKERPSILFVGTSFLHAFLRSLDKHRVYTKRDFYYYFRRNLTFPRRKSHPLDKNAIDWENEVFSHDAIVIEINEAFVHKAGYGFIRHALSALKDAQLKRRAG